MISSLSTKAVKDMDTIFRLDFYGALRRSHDESHASRSERGFVKLIRKTSRKSVRNVSVTVVLGKLATHLDLNREL